MNKTVAALGGVGLGTGIAAYMLARNGGHKGRRMLDRFGVQQPRRRWGRRRDEWTPTSRFLAGVAGGALSYYGIRRPGLVGRAASAAGMALATRGISNRGSRQLFGLIPAIGGLRGR